MFRSKPQTEEEHKENGQTSANTESQSTERSEEQSHNASKPSAENTSENNPAHPASTTEQKPKKAFSFIKSKKAQPSPNPESQHQNTQTVGQNISDLNKLLAATSGSNSNPSNVVQDTHTDNPQSIPPKKGFSFVKKTPTQTSHQSSGSTQEQKTSPIEKTPTPKEQPKEPPKKKGPNEYTRKVKKIQKENNHIR